MTKGVAHIELMREYMKICEEYHAAGKSNPWKRVEVLGDRYEWRPVFGGNPCWFSTREYRILIPPAETATRHNSKGEAARNELWYVAFVLAFLAGIAVGVNL